MVQILISFQDILAQLLTEMHSLTSPRKLGYPASFHSQCPQLPILGSNLSSVPEQLDHFMPASTWGTTWVTSLLPTLWSAPQQWMAVALQTNLAIVIPIVCLKNDIYFVDLKLIMSGREEGHHTWHIVSILHGLWIQMMDQLLILRRLKQKWRQVWKKIQSESFFSKAGLEF